MHRIMGYSLDEWMAMVTILGFLGGLLIWLFKLAISSGTKNLADKISRLINRIENLTHTMKSIESTANRTAQRVDTLEDRFEEHLGEAKVRNQRITALEKEVFNRDKN